MSNVTIFNFEQNEVRTVLIDNEPYFVGKDVASILGYSNTRDALVKHCKAKADVAIHDGSQNRKMAVIPERDVYRLIMRSKLPAAEQFEEWVVGTVLPAIRKTGGYIQGEEHAESEDELIFRAMQVMERKIAAMKPKAEYHDKWMSSEGSYTTTEIAKQLGTTAVKLNNFLREKGIKWQNKDLPISGYESWFKMIDIAYNDKNTGKVGIKKQCRVSATGAKQIVDLWEKSF